MYMSHMHSDVTIECPNKMPVPEGSSVVIWCETGLSDSQLVQVVFKFWGREGTCPSVHVDDGHSSWTVKRNESEPYTCGLHIDNIQPSDSGDYYCDVNLPGTLTVRSNIVHVEVASEPTNLGINVPLILETTIPGGIMLILIVLTVTITVTCIVHHRNRNRQGPHHQDERNRLLPRNPQGKIHSTLLSLVICEEGMYSILGLHKQLSLAVLSFQFYCLGSRDHIIFIA